MIPIDIIRLTHDTGFRGILQMYMTPIILCTTITQVNVTANEVKILNPHTSRVMTKSPIILYERATKVTLHIVKYCSKKTKQRI